MSQRKPDDPKVGIECPRCGCRDLRVVYTRPRWDATTRRVRECRHCGKRVRTDERIAG